jgi:hypothetical protein
MVFQGKMSYSLVRQGPAGQRNTLPEHLGYMSETHLLRTVAPTYQTTRCHSTKKEKSLIACVQPSSGEAVPLHDKAEV